MVFSPPLSFRHTKPGQAIKPGTTLRILGVGDSITVGYLSDIDGGDGNGYRLKLRDDLSKDQVVFSGTETMGGTMPGGYFAAWSGMTIQFISDHVGPSLQQRPNIVLVHAGTNDMNPNLDVAKEGNDPEEAADRLGKLIDKITEGCPDATVLVGIIIGCHDETQMGNIAHFQSLIPGVVQTRRDAGQHVLAVDFSTFPMDALRDGLHPTNPGYQLMGDYWYDFIAQIPADWIQKPIGDDPRRSGQPDRTKPIEVGSGNWGQRLLGLVFGKTA